MPAMEDQLCEDTEEKLKVTERDEEPAQREREEKVTEEAQGPVPDLVPQGEQQQQENGGETDSLKVSQLLLSGEGAEMDHFPRTLTLWQYLSRNAKLEQQHLTLLIRHLLCLTAGLLFYITCCCMQLAWNYFTHAVVERAVWGPPVLW